MYAQKRLFSGGGEERKKKRTDELICSLELIWKKNPRLRCGAIKELLRLRESVEERRYFPTGRLVDSVALQFVRVNGKKKLKNQSIHHALDT